MKGQKFLSFILIIWSFSLLYCTPFKINSKQTEATVKHITPMNYYFKVDVLLDNDMFVKNVEEWKVREGVTVTVIEDEYINIFGINYHNKTKINNNLI